MMRNKKLLKPKKYEYFLIYLKILRTSVGSLLSNGVVNDQDITLYFLRGLPQSFQDGFQGLCQHVWTRFCLVYLLLHSHGVNLENH